MSARTLLQELRGLGVVLAADGDCLLVDAPNEVITDGLRDTLTEHKPHLLKLLEWERRMPKEAALGPRRPPGAEAKRLLAAGWSPKERSGRVIWRKPGGSWYGEEVALLLLARDRGPP
ncbi:MAG: hypothetical protein M3P49_11935 [Actinomycetota bacterium]|nr:hypothetical protein [Actinomycetota bacterium]